MNDRGASLLETIAALAVTSLFAASALPQAQAAVARLAEIRVHARALTSARNLVEAWLATPCATGTTLADCPDELTCSARHGVLVVLPGPEPRPVDRLVVRVAAREEPDTALATLSVARARSHGCN